MSEQTLTLNQSAGIVKSILADLLENAPGACEVMWYVNTKDWIEDQCETRGVSFDQLFPQHVIWLEAGLRDVESLELMDKLAARLRKVGGEALAKTELQDSPWRD